MDGGAAPEYKLVVDEQTPLLYKAYCPPPKPLSPEDIAQRRRSLGIASVLSIDASSLGLSPGYLSASDVISRKSSQSFRSDVSVSAVPDELEPHDQWWLRAWRRVTRCLCCYL
ncbi:hypothetical protein H4S02_001020 [Coemansia sp. RSA 2611]|nr:hypothetical protein LPJ70_003789 [Coemansia sp. RSA 2708]KAJ2309220.1 hypothetical protein IWW54_003848 [Coemansia sp. RSA 2705]KAJ2316594.1 hypothetical protein IWW52_003569 [Coemansia sp. RSA 2704]KAJ2366143.1 hypothetical protein H4S01_002873 [Coemansia sp. RSA 2610]KAJ2392008.1 hypothetical protein H4S02_001020 [Coemansia sp. RSA 2611]KAJ2733350.1 hypothetical protein H4R23_002632 [Coemansia sp. Cherry 401B]